MEWNSSLNDILCVTYLNAIPKMFQLFAVGSHPIDNKKKANVATVKGVAEKFSFHGYVDMKLGILIRIP